eukprot:SAG11_NODE_777_length_7218_cov_24.269420_10_plen_130_part_00
MIDDIITKIDHAFDIQRLQLQLHAARQSKDKHRSRWKHTTKQLENVKMQVRVLKDKLENVNMQVRVLKDKLEELRSMNDALHESNAATDAVIVQLKAHLQENGMDKNVFQAYENGRYTPRMTIAAMTLL